MRLGDACQAGMVVFPHSTVRSRGNYCTSLVICAKRLKFKFKLPKISTQNQSRLEFMSSERCPQFLTYTTSGETMRHTLLCDLATPSAQVRQGVIMGAVTHVEVTPSVLQYQLGGVRFVLTVIDVHLELVGL